MEDILPEEALLLWLELYPYAELGRLTATELKKSVAALWDDMVSHSTDTVEVKTKVEEEETVGSILSRIVSSLETIYVSFIHQLTPERSDWVLGHEEGRVHIEKVFGDRVHCTSYFDCNTPELAEAAIEDAVSKGAQVIFTTAPMLSRATLKAAVKYPKVRFLNCSVDQPYTSIRTYYGRIYEAKFITGAIAGAMAQNDRIGFIASYPIFGVPASINAFALGAQLTNPRAQIELRWSCVEGNPQEDFLADGIRVVSNREVTAQSKAFLDFCSYGTYLMDDRGDLIPLGSPLWVWGKFYEFAIRSIQAGGWKRDKEEAAALNYWLGMDSGVIDLELSDKLPEGVRHLAKMISRSVADGSMEIFRRKIVAQDGTVKNEGGRTFTPSQILHMDWLCSNVIGSIPTFDQILPVSQRMVRELGIYRDAIPAEKEVKPREDFDHLR